MKKFLIVLFSVTSMAAQAQEVIKVTDPVEWINPLMGTDSRFELSDANTYPAIALAWGMNTWVPQTGAMGDDWIYTYDAIR